MRHGDEYQRGINVEIGKALRGARGHAAPPRGC